MERRTPGPLKGSANLMPGNGRLAKLQRDRDGMRGARAQTRGNKDALSHSVPSQSPIPIVSQAIITNCAANRRQSPTADITAFTIASSPDSSQSPHRIYPQNLSDDSDISLEKSVISQPKLHTSSINLSLARRAGASEIDRTSSQRQSPQRASQRSTSNRFKTVWEQSPTSPAQSPTRFMTSRRPKQAVAQRNVAITNARHLPQPAPSHITTNSSEVLSEQPSTSRTQGPVFRDISRVKPTNGKPIKDMTRSSDDAASKAPSRVRPAVSGRARKLSLETPSRKTNIARTATFRNAETQRPPVESRNVSTDVPRTPAPRKTTSSRLSREVSWLLKQSKVTVRKQEFELRSRKEFEAQRKTDASNFQELNQFLMKEEVRKHRQVNREGRSDQLKDVELHDNTDEGNESESEDDDGDDDDDGSQSLWVAWEPLHYQNPFSLLTSQVSNMQYKPMRY